MAASKTYNIILVGYKGQGKSSTVQKLSGHVKYKGKDTKVKLETFEIQEEGPTSMTKVIKLVDTPGLGSLSVSDRKLMNKIHKEALCTENVDAFLLVFKKDRIKSTQMNNIRELHKIFGDSYLQKSIIVLTHSEGGDENSTQEFVETSPEEFKTLYESCGKRIWCTENSDWEDRKEEREKLIELIESMETVPYDVPGERGTLFKLWKCCCRCYCCPC